MQGMDGVVNDTEYCCATTSTTDTAAMSVIACMLKPLLLQTPYLITVTFNIYDARWCVHVGARDLLAVVGRLTMPLNLASLALTRSPHMLLNCPIYYTAAKGRVAHMFIAYRAIAMAMVSRSVVADGG